MNWRTCNVSLLLGAVCLLLVFSNSCCASTTTPNDTPTIDSAIPNGDALALSNATTFVTTATNDVCIQPIDRRAFDASANGMTIIVIMAISGSSLVIARIIDGYEMFSTNSLVMFATQLLKFFGIGVIFNAARYHLQFAFKLFTSYCMLQHNLLGRYSVGLTILLCPLTLILIPIMESFILSRETLNSRIRTKSQALRNTLKCIDDSNIASDLESKVPNDKLDALKSQEGQVDDECAANDQASRRIFWVEFGILIQAVIVGFTLSVATTNFRWMLTGVICYQICEGLSLYTRLIQTRPFIEKLVASIFPCYVSAMAFGVLVGINLRRVLVDNAYHVLVVQGIFNALTAGVFLYYGIENFVPLIAAPNSCKKVTLFLATCLGAVFMGVLGNYV